MRSFPIFALVIQVLYVAGIIVFARFYAQEEGTRRARMIAIVGAFVAVVLTLLFGFLMGGAIGVVAGFYAADHKNRGRGWAFLPLLLGPVGLLILVFLPKQPDTSTLSLTL